MANQSETLVGTGDPNYYYDMARVSILNLKNTLWLSVLLHPNERWICLLDQLPFSQPVGSLYGYPGNLFKSKLTVSMRELYISL